jgi:hypothetical protein
MLFTGDWHKDRLLLGCAMIPQIVSIGYFTVEEYYKNLK